MSEKFLSGTKNSKQANKQTNELQFCVTFNVTLLVTCTCTFNELSLCVKVQGCPWNSKFQRERVARFICQIQLGL